MGSRLTPDEIPDIRARVERCLGPDWNLDWLEVADMLVALDTIEAVTAELQSARSLLAAMVSVARTYRDGLPEGGRSLTPLECDALRMIAADLCAVCGEVPAPTGTCGTCNAAIWQRDDADG